MRPCPLAAGSDPTTAEAVEDHEHGPAFMSDHRQRQRQIEEQPARYQHQHGADRDDEVLPDDRGGPSCQTLRIGQLLHVFRQ